MTATVIERSRPSPLLERIWTHARDSAYAAGHGPEFDAITTEVEALRAQLGSDTTMETAMAMYSLALQRKALVQPPQPSLSGVPA